MPAYRTPLRVAVVALLGLALVAGCSSNKSGSSAQKLLGVSGHVAAIDNGLSLDASPTELVIDLANPATPTDPNRNNEHYGEVVLLVIANDADSKPQPLLPIVFSASAGVLASHGLEVKTDTTGQVVDTLRVYESDPDSIQVSATDGTRHVMLDIRKVVTGPPVANAGPDQTVECTGNSSAQVKLNGLASTDPNGDIQSYEWFEYYGTAQQVLLARGPAEEVMLPLGEHLITLRVTDSAENTSTDEVVVRVVDTTPPIVTLSVTPSRIWPPNHKMVHVVATVNVVECGPYTVSLESVTSNEPDNGLGDGDTSGDIQGVATGTADYGFDLRAERSGGGNGRVYTIVYRVVDAGGLATIKTARVVVPHDQSGK